MRGSVRKLAISVTSLIALAYFAYRAFYTLNLTTPYAVFASLLLLAGEFFGIMSMLLYFFQVWKIEEPTPEPVLPDRTVDVFVPTYNEDVQLLRTTLLACLRMDYPHQTYVLDDGRRGEVETLARELGVHYLTRPDNRHAKAGNLNHAFEKTSGEFVIVLDADHVPEPNFITRMIGHFRDERMAFVQSPHAFYNFDSFQAREDYNRKLYLDEGELFYHVIQPGRNRWNAAIFAGSAVMFRRRALEEIGYIAVETITEDMHTGLRMHAKGWKSLAIRDRLIAGQAAPDVSTFHTQRLRWAEGNLSIFAYDNPLTMAGLSAAQRICYFGVMIHWAAGLFKAAIYLTPILMLITGVPPVSDFTWTLLTITLVYLLMNFAASKIISNGRARIANYEMFSMMVVWTQIRAVFRALFRRRLQKFIVTSKRGRQSTTLWPFVRPYFLFLFVSAIALIWGWYRPLYGISDDPYKPLIPSLWVVFHMILAVMVIRRSLWPTDQRYAYRHLVHLPVNYQLEDTEAQASIGLGMTADLNDTGMALITYEALPLGSSLRLTLHAAGDIVPLDGIIQTAANLASAAGQTIGPVAGCRYGIAFRNLTDDLTDRLNRICLHYAVPRQYERYGERQTLWERIQLVQVSRISEVQSRRPCW